jgi:high-affinity K+ transport system ATPase subunit B
MNCPASGARLVTLAGLALILAPSIVGTAITAVGLAAIATATDEHLGAAAGAQKEAAGPFTREFT